MIFFKLFWNSSWRLFLNCLFADSTRLRTGPYFCYFYRNVILWNEKSFKKKKKHTCHLLWVFLVIKILNAVNLKKSSLTETTLLLYTAHYDGYLKSTKKKKKNGAWWKQSFKPSKDITMKVLTCLRIFPSSEEFNRVPIIVISIIFEQYFWMTYAWTAIKGKLFILMWIKYFIRRYGCKVSVPSFIYMLYAALNLENWASPNTLSWQLSCFCDLGQSV